MGNKRTIAGVSKVRQLEKYLVRTLGHVTLLISGQLSDSQGNYRA